MKPKNGLLIKKKVLDIFLSLLIIVIISPILILMSLIVFIVDGKPIMFKQDRVGINEEIFKVYKFRTMKRINEQQKENNYDYEWEEGVPSSFVFKSSSSNPNITKSGYFMRKYSIDELPQFFNVLKGEMSIVGPRPEIPDLTKYYNHYQKQRLLVKPGITGLAQVRGRSEISHGEKIEYDLEYIRNMNIKRDLRIVYSTIIQAIFGKGSF